MKTIEKSQELILADRIDKFLETYGKKDAIYEEEWSSPDACELEYVSDCMKMNGQITRLPWSEWGSGGYGPYTSKEGRTEHDAIIKLISVLVKKQSLSLT
jgi:hypothetical protein